MRYLGPTFGGINLEDIKAPDCFVIEERLRELMDIPVFHDDQHGTAIISAAGIINALHLTGRKIEDIKVVVNGAGAAGIACLELLKAMGLPNANAILCDTKGVIYRGRTEGMNQWKAAHAVETKARTLADALKGADVFLGLSVKGAVTPGHGQDAWPRRRSSSPWPIPIRRSRRKKCRRCARRHRRHRPQRLSQPGQQCVWAFPTSSAARWMCARRTINEEMKIAAAEALAELAREDVPDEVAPPIAARGRSMAPTTSFRCRSIRG